MKKDNKNIIRIFEIFNLSIIILIILNIVMYVGILPSKYHIIPAYVFTLFIVFLIYINSKKGNQYFYLETRGETITFETRNIGLLSTLSSTTNKIDLPKYKLIKYEYHEGVISKEIFFYINSKKNPSNLTKVKFRLAYISNQNIKLILSELDKIVQSNYKIKEKVQEVN